MTTGLEIGNRELQHVERSVQERATLLSATHPSLRFQDVTPQELDMLVRTNAIEMLGLDPGDLRPTRAVESAAR